MRERAAAASLRIALILCVGLACGLSATSALSAETAEALFHDGTKAYQVADYPRASRAFRKSAGLQLASGTLQSLGNAEWQRGETGAAVLAWEQALWVDGFNQAARQNLSYARKAAELESPEVSWHEAGFHLASRQQLGLDFRGELMVGGRNGATAGDNASSPRSVAPGDSGARAHGFPNQPARATGGPKPDGHWVYPPPGHASTFDTNRWRGGDDPVARRSPGPSGKNARQIRAGQDQSYARVD
jgi:hypothetical protein